MAKKLVCPICEEQIFLQHYNHKYLYPWDGDNRTGKNVHKECVSIAIEKGLYQEPERVGLKYNLDAVFDEEDSW